jgi:hypothetical protein
MAGTRTLSDHGLMILRSNLYHLEEYVEILALDEDNEYVGDVTIPTQVIKYNQCCSRRISQSDCCITVYIPCSNIPYINVAAINKVWYEKF